jgi:hypothetical protein
MTTQEYPAVQRQPAELTVRITAGTAVKLGFFGALGVALFSVIIWVILGIVGLMFGAALLPVLQQLMQR